MWSRCYRRHVIMAFPSFDTITNSWAPQADISWPTGSERDSEFVRFPIRVMSEREAVACALRNGKFWIDNHLKQTHVSAPQRDTMEPSEHSQRGFGAPARDSAEKLTFGRRSNSIDGLSFSQFKFALRKLGAGISERSLRRSYSALMKLQKRGDCSLTEIRSKVKHSQKLVSPSGGGGVRRGRLPLTQRDWRNLV